MGFQSLRVRQQVASVTMDGDFAYFQVGCGHVICRREGNRIVLIASPPIVSLLLVAASTWSRSR